MDCLEQLNFRSDLCGDKYCRKIRQKKVCQWSKYKDKLYQVILSSSQKETETSVKIKHVNITTDGFTKLHPKK